MAASKGTDTGAALSGLVLGGSVIFLVMLLVVWLTNSSFANKEGHGPAANPAVPAATSAAVPVTPGAATTTPAAGGAPAH